MKAEPGGWRLPLTLTLAVQTLVAAAMYCAPVLAPVAAPELGVAPAAVGVFVALGYLGAMIASAASGGWVARKGAVRTSQAALLACCAGLALAAAAPSPAVALAAALLIGFGYGPATPASSLLLARTAPARLYALVFSIKQTGVPAGAALAGALAPALVLALGWRATALAFAAACALAAFAIEPGRRRYDTGLEARAPAPLRRLYAPVALVLGEARLRHMALTSFVYGGVQITLVAYLVTFLAVELAFPLVLAGAVMAVSQGASVAGRILWGWVADRLVARRTMLGLLGAAMAASAMAALAASPAWPEALVILWAALFGATAVGWNGVFLAEVARLAPAGREGEATGGCLFFTFLGVVVAPPAFASALSATGSFGAAYAAFSVPALAVALWLLASRRRA